MCLAINQEVILACLKANNIEAKGYFASSYSLYNQDGMRPISYAYRVVVCVCLAALLFAALTHPDTALSVAILAPFWVFLAAIVSPPIRTTDESYALPAFPVLPLFSPRPPPVR